jgi:uncharacterized protein YceH (UPF0502 family)
VAEGLSLQAAARIAALEDEVASLRQRLHDGRDHDGAAGST